MTCPEFFDPQTRRPVKRGLFCAQIFGPTTDGECLCGKFKAPRYDGVVCDVCGVVVTTTMVRAERFGHIELASPCAHVWFLPHMADLLGASVSHLRRVVLWQEEFEDPAGTPAGEVGVHLLRERLRTLDLDALKLDLSRRFRLAKSRSDRSKLRDRLQVVRTFRRTGTLPEWTLLEVLPVLPPALRPLNEPGPDVNALYRRVIERNRLVRQILKEDPPPAIERHERRLLQQTVDDLIQEGFAARSEPSDPVWFSIWLKAWGVAPG